MRKIVGHVLEHVEGYEEVTRVGSCLDSTGLQISGCVFKHGGALCLGVVCGASERADGRFKIVTRTGIRKAERRKAMRVAEKHAIAAARRWSRPGIPEFLDSGMYNAVYALSADLVLRIQRRAGEEDSSWDFYEAAQLYPHQSLPTVWELGEFKGYKFAIVERMECMLGDLEGLGRPVSLEEVEEAAAPAVAHLLNVTNRVAYDTHDYNIMKRRKKDEFVLVDCFLDYGDSNVANQ